MIEYVRIAVLDAYDHVVAYLDNSAPKALHYYDDELHEYLKGTAYTFSFCAGAKHEDSRYLVVGNKLSFVRGDKEYYLNIMSARQDEYKIEVEAYSLSFELLNEEKEAYKAEKAMSLKEYLSIFDFERVLTLGNNEVSDKSIKHEWTGTDTLLARVFSLCTVFDAEAEFVIQLNDNYSLNKIVLNVYQEHSDTVQGVGVKRTDIILRYGKNVTGVTKTAEITGLYTAIRPTGKDGLTIAELDKKEYDADGNLEYYTSKGSRNILAPQARDRFPSNLMSGENDRYIAKIWSYDTDNVNMLYGQALAELKKNCVPQIKYEVNGFFDTNIGDTVSIEDDQYIPTLYLEARVTEQVRSFTDRTRNKTTFDNFKEVQAQLDPSLVAKMNALIEQNKTYTCMISTDNGTSFKNNEGSTTLTASVSDGVNDVTDNFSISWKKDGADLNTGKSITINAAEVDGKALYRFEAKDSSGNVKGFYEVTVTDVSDGKDGENGSDGKSSYTHIKYSDDGETFTGMNNTMPQSVDGWRNGYYSSTTTVNTESPNKSDANRICVDTIFEVDAGKTYLFDTGNEDVTFGRTTYNSDGSCRSVTREINHRAVWTPSEGIVQIRVFLHCEGATADTWKELFDSGSLVPYFGESADTVGTYPGAWMGTLVSEDPTPSTVFEDYTWVKVKGDPGKDGLDGLQGEKGDQGIPGKDGTSSYTHIAYANSADGHTDFSVSDSDREYIGMYVDDQLTDSENPDDYRWTLVKGQDGANGTPGKAGEDGKTPYLHIAYANSADGQTDFSVSDSKGKSYIGQYTDYVEPDSTDPSDYTWSKIKGEDGKDGADGKDGVDGTGYTVLLSNESHTFPGSTSAAIESSVSADVMAFKNDSRIPVTVTKIGDAKNLVKTTGAVTVDASTDGITIDTGLDSVDGFMLYKANSSNNATHGWIYSDSFNGYLYYMPSGYTIYAYKSSAKVTISNGMVTCTQHTSSYPIEAGTYNWIAFGSSKGDTDIVSYKTETIEVSEDSDKLVFDTGFDTVYGAVIYESSYSGANTDKRNMGGIYGENVCGGIIRTGVVSGSIPNYAKNVGSNVYISVSGGIVTCNQMSDSYPIKAGSVYHCVAWGATAGEESSGDKAGIPGLTATVTDNGTISCAITFRATTELTTQSGVVPITMEVDGQTVTKNFSFALALTGANGKDGQPTGITESADEPTERYVGMLWKNTGTTAGLVQGATYRWNGESWDMYKFSAENIEAKTFKGYTFDGSIFKSDFEESVGSNTRQVGTMTIENGRINIDSKMQTRENVDAEWMDGTSRTVYLGYNGLRFTESDSSGTVKRANLTLDDLQKLLALISN